MSRRTTMVALAMTTLLIAGCGTTSESRSGSNDYGSVSESNYDSTEFKSTASADYDYDEYESSGSDGGYNPSDVLDQATSEAGGGISSESEGTTEATATDVPDVETGVDPATQSMIRRTADISLESEKYDEATKAMNALLQKYSLVTLSDNSQVSESYSGSASYRTRNIQFRIKSEQFDEFCDAIESGTDTWDVTTMDKSADDVTKQYNDNTQKIEALRARYDWYRQRLEQTNDENVAMGYSEKMFDALEEIKYLENANKGIETDVAYSIVSIHMHEDLGTAVTVKESDDVWAKVGEELSILPNSLMTALGTFVLVLLKLLPSLVILLILIAFAILVARIVAGHRRKHPRPAKQMPTPQSTYYQQVASQMPGGVPSGAPAPNAVNSVGIPRQAVPQPQAGTNMVGASETRIATRQDVVVQQPTDETAQSGFQVEAGEADDSGDMTDGSLDAMMAELTSDLDEEGASPAGEPDEPSAHPSQPEASDEPADDFGDLDEPFSQAPQLENLGSVWDDVPDASYTKIEEFGNLEDADELD